MRVKSYLIFDKCKQFLDEAGICFEVKLIVAVNPLRQKVQCTISDLKLMVIHLAGGVRSDKRNTSDIKYLLGLDLSSLAIPRTRKPRSDLHCEWTIKREDARSLAICSRETSDRQKLLRHEDSCFFPHGPYLRDAEHFSLMKVNSS